MIKENIGFIGLGEMGLPMAINLQKEGYRVYAYEINPATILKANNEGIITCKSPGEVAQNSDNAVISIVRNLQQTEDVIFGKDGINSISKKGLTIIVMSTLDPVTMKDLDAKVSAAGNYLVDAPVSGAKSGAEARTLTIMSAGKEETVNKCQDYFKCMGKNIFYFGSQIGAGQAAKLSNNLILAINMVTFAEGLSFAQKYNLEPDVFRNLITVSTGNSWVAQNWETVKLWWENYSPNTTLDIVYKDMFAIMKECAANNYSLPLGGLAFHLLRDAWSKEK